MRSAAHNEYFYLSYFMDTATPLYGGGRGVTVEDDRSIRNGDTANTKQLRLHNHSGTHIDFPNHFFLDGSTSESYPADFWIFKHPYLVLIEVEENELVQLSEQQLAGIPDNTDFLMIKTGFGRYRAEEKYCSNNPGISIQLAEQLVKRSPELRAVGVDLISVTSYQDRETGRKVHRIFLGNEFPLLLVEDMNLAHLNESPSEVMCFPLMISGLDGAPVSIIARK